MIYILYMYHIVYIIYIYDSDIIYHRNRYVIQHDMIRWYDDMIHDDMTQEIW